MMYRKKKREKKGAPIWMVTFSDMMTLILVFFILLFSMSSVDAQKFKTIAESFQQREILDFLPSIIEFDEMLNEDQESIEAEDIVESLEELNMDELLENVNEFLEQNELTEHVSATRDERGVVLVLQERTLFESAEAELLPESKLFLNKVGTLLEVIPNMVIVEGHTDNRPISNYRYPSNWELSGARASSVIRYLNDNYTLDPARFIAAGYGDTRPVVPNTTVENLHKNRRVVIVISDPETAEY